MRTFIFCTSYVNSTNPAHHKDRYERWIAFYMDKMQAMGSDHLFLIDDGSPEPAIGNNTAMLDPFNLSAQLNKVSMVHFKKNLGRPSIKNYQGWWRSFSFSIMLAQQYDFEKIIHVESDFFLTSTRMMEFIRSLSSGWTTLYSRFHGFPESGIQVICKDVFPEFKNLYNKLQHDQFMVNQSAELYLPFTYIEKGFYGDRLGQLDVFESWLEHITPSLNLDYIGQVLPQFKPGDFEPFFEFEYKWK